MRRPWRKWIPALVFWALFSASIGLVGRYPWLDTLWYAGGLLFIVGLSVYSLTYALHHPHEKGDLSVQGIPRRLRKFAEDTDSTDDSADAKSCSTRSSR